MADNLFNKFQKNKKYMTILKKYPDLYKHPIMLNQAINDYEAIKSENGYIEQMYKTLPYSLTPQNKSDIRHPLTNYEFMKSYPENFVRDLGKFKEEIDQEENKPLWDTKQDLINNEFGIELYKKYPNAPSIIIFDKIIQNAGLPLPARNNKLFGYITNTIDEN